MTRRELWSQVFVRLVDHRNCDECGKIADLAVAEWDARFGAVPQPRINRLQSSSQKGKP